MRTTKTRGRSPRRGLMLGLGLATTALLVAGCGSSGSSATTAAAPDDTASQAALDPGDPSSQAMKNLYEKAVAAGQTSVVIYGPTSGTDQLEWAAFKKAFPKITVTGVPIVGPPMDAKLGAEASSGKYLGDIAYTGAPNMLNYAQKGYFTSFKPTLPTGASLVDGAVGPNDDFYGVTVTVAGTVTNSNTVKTPPKTYTDLESSKYKGKIAMYDPTAVGLQADLFAHLALDPKYDNLMSALKDNDVQLFPPSSITGPLTAVAQGAKEVAMGVGFPFFQGAKKAGAPVRFSLFDEDNYSVILYQAQLKGAPHPLAAQLYENWMFTPAAAAAIAQEGLYSTVTGAVAPNGLPPLSSVPLQKEIPLSDIVAASNAAIAQANTHWAG